MLLNDQKCNLAADQANKSLCNLKKMKSNLDREQVSRISAHFTWSKEVSDRWTFLKQNFCHKKPKVLR